jgi:hypothetical protein
MLETRDILRASSGELENLDALISHVLMMIIFFIKKLSIQTNTIRGKIIVIIKFLRDIKFLYPTTLMSNS